MYSVQISGGAGSGPVDVVVVGAGPVGLLAAIELTLAGVRAIVLERLTVPSTTIKALGVGPLGAESLIRRGMAGPIAVAEERAFAVMAQFTGQGGPGGPGGRSRFGGHFGGLTLIRRDAQKEPDRRARLADQQAIEAMLGQRARDLGIEVRRGCQVTGFTQSDDGVDVRWSSPEGDGVIRCAYLIGCDGGRSAVRKMAGFAFPGTDPTMTMYQAVTEIDHPERLLPIGWRRTPGGVFAYGPFPGRLFMLDFSGPPADRQAPVTRDEIESVLRRISGIDVRVKSLEVANRWTDNTRLVDSYRMGRIFLAGDAAHVHSPFGGQGLSLGMVDATNLGWKLAAVIRGDMPESLLDTYTTERRPVAEAVLHNTLAQVAIMRPDPQAGAMRDIIAKLMEFDDVNQFIGQMMTGLGVRYDLGSNRDEVGRVIGDRPIHRGGTDVLLFDLMQEGGGLLLDAGATGAATAIVAAGRGRIATVAVDAGPSMLIRPDACVAWIGDGDHADGLQEALDRWFFDPR